MLLRASALDIVGGRPSAFRRHEVRFQMHVSAICPGAMSNSVSCRCISRKDAAVSGEHDDAVTRRRQNRFCSSCIRAFVAPGPTPRGVSGGVVVTERSPADPLR